MKQATIRSKITIVAGAIIGLVLIAAITVIVLQLLVPHSNTTSKTAIRPKADPTPSSIVADVERAKDIPALSGYSKLPVDGASGSLVYRATDQPYDVLVTSKTFAYFTTKDEAKKLDVPAVVTQLNPILKNAGLRQIAGDASSQTFASDTIICRLGGMQALTPSYSFVCIGIDQIKAEYAADAQLLELYKKAVPTDTLHFTLVSRVTAKQDDKQSAIVSLSSADNKTKPRMLMFAAVNNVWEYITDINSGTIAQGKYMVSAEALQALHNPKYGDFLLNQLP